MLNDLLRARGIVPLGLYPVETVARILGVTAPSVRRLIRLGSLPAIRRRRSIIGITHHALDTFLSSGGHVGGAA